MYASFERMNCKKLLTVNTAFYTLDASSGKCNVMFWRLSVCPIGILTVTHKGEYADVTWPAYILAGQLSRNNILVI